jgi:16S rRNA (adenine1518-N6/adenine1519-N6)-dimethyltransferase
MIKAKKSYGQHFLKSEDIAERIGYSLKRVSETKQILEVGPGMGMLTKYLLAQKEYNTFAVEADADMVTYLKSNYPILEPNLIFKDFLDFKPETVFGESQFSLIGNFPYNISSQIIFWILDYRPQVTEMVGMFQKEVADRIVSKPGSKVYGIISVICQAYYDTEYLFTVEPNSFVPPPKVMSSVIRLTRKDGFVLDCDEQKFKQLIKAAFNQRRKMLRNTLKPFFPEGSLMDDPFFQKRPEELGWQDYVKLTKMTQINA